MNESQGGSSEPFSLAKFIEKSNQMSLLDSSASEAARGSENEIQGKIEAALNESKQGIALSK